MTIRTKEARWQFWSLTFTQAPAGVILCWWALLFAGVWSLAFHSFRFWAFCYWNRRHLARLSIAFVCRAPWYATYLENIGHLGMIMFCGCDKYKFKVVSMTNDRVIIRHCKKRVQLLFFFVLKIMRNNYFKKKMYEAHDSASMSCFRSLLVDLTFSLLKSWGVSSMRATLINLSESISWAKTAG